MHFYIRKLSNFSSGYITKVLKPLTLGPNTSSIMIDRILLSIDNRNYSTSNKDTAILVHKNKKVIAWSLTFGFEEKEPKIMIFVSKKHRNKGIGRSLINKTFNYLKTKGFKYVFVAAWDGQSRKFYSKLGGLKKKSKYHTVFNRKVFLNDF